MRALFMDWGSSDLRPASFKPVSPEKMGLAGKSWGWVLGTGALFVTLGVIALALPVLSTLVISLTTATLLVVGGSAYLTRAFRIKLGRGTAIRFLVSIFSIATGFLIWRYPGGGMLAIAIALSFYFFIGGAFQWNLATSLRPEKGWGLGVISALVSFLMGIALLVTFPFSALWMPGALLGIDVAISGIAMIGFAVSVRSKKSRLKESPPTKVGDFYDAA